MKPINKKLANKMRILRKQFSYTQAKLAELSGIEYKHIQRLESKTPNDLRLSTLEKLAKAFKMPPSKLIDFD